MPLTSSRRVVLLMKMLFSTVASITGSIRRIKTSRLKAIKYPNRRILER
jgi:hypothetical protein